MYKIRILNKFHRVTSVSAHLKIDNMRRIFSKFNMDAVSLATIKNSQYFVVYILETKTMLAKQFKSELKNYQHAHSFCSIDEYLNVNREWCKIKLY
jgi:hypothetical protein